jgi:hypothetical protein
MKLKTALSEYFFLLFVLETNNILQQMCQYNGDLKCT